MDQLTISMGVYLWALYFFPFIYVFFLSPKPHCIHYCSFIVSLEVGYCQSSNTVLHCCPVYSRSFAFPHEVWNQLVNVHKTVCWDFEWDYRTYRSSWKESTSWKYWTFQSRNTDYICIYLRPSQFLHIALVNILLDLYISISFFGCYCKWYCVLISNSNYSFLAYKKAIDFCILTLYPANLL